MAKEKRTKIEIKTEQSNANEKNVQTTNDLKKKKSHYSFVTACGYTWPGKIEPFVYVCFVSLLVRQLDRQFVAPAPEKEKTKMRGTVLEEPQKVSDWTRMTRTNVGPIDLEVKK